MSSPRFHSLWAINGPLDEARLCAQLDAFKAAGLDGVVFHPRFYPNDPPYLGSEYLGIVSAVILHAKAVGLAFWIYDENGWPSGTVGGELLRQHPELVQRWAGLYRERPDRCLTEFEHAGHRWYLGEKTGAGVDYLNPALSQHFIRLTHERYRTGLVPEAFAHVEAFFCDEPEFGLGHAHAALPIDGAIPWTADLEQLYAACHGEDLLPLARDLFFTSERSAAVRVRFWELLRDRFCAAFVEPLNAWCESHGKRFAVHLKGEEHPHFQVPMVGSCSAVFRQVGLPGIDALERRPGNDFYPRQLASSALQFGDGRCMAEAFGGAGWGATPADLERYLLWLGRHGVTDFVMHLAQSRLDSAAIRDWPPSQPFHLTWAEAYPAVLRKVREQLAALPGTSIATLVVSPHRAIMAGYEPRELLETNIHNAATYPDSPAAAINRGFMAGIAALQASGACWHVTDEATFETHARREGGMVRLGRCAYREVLVADGAQLGAPWRGFPKLGSGVITQIIPTRKSAALQLISPNWRMSRVTRNSLLLEPVPREAGGFAAQFMVEKPAGTALTLRFADDIEAVSLNGLGLDLATEGEGTIVPLPAAAVVSTNVVHFRTAAGAAHPFVWLEGEFSVVSGSPFSPGPGQALQTSGPFRVAAPLTEVPAEFASGGYPFLHRSVILTAEVDVPAAAKGLRLLEVAADAVHLSIDGRALGWTWGPGWEVAAEVTAGRHEIELRMVPSGYNYFGPHHYYRGDAAVISPDQFSGRKNFADPLDAPPHTLSANWHFVPMHAPRTLAFLS